MASFYNRYYPYYRPFFPASRLVPRNVASSVSSKANDSHSFGCPKNESASACLSADGSSCFSSDDRGKFSSFENVKNFSESFESESFKNVKSCSSSLENGESCSRSNGGFSFGPLYFNNVFLGVLESPVFEVFGIKLFLDDIIIVGLLFFLYNEGVQDEMLYIALVLLLIG